MSKKLEIDGPAGRNEVSREYRDHYDEIFRKPMKSNEKGMEDK